MKQILRCALLPVLLVLGTAAQAIPITFTYSGNELDVESGPGCPPPDICEGVSSIFGWFTVDLDFDTGGESVDFTSRVLRYRFTDGVTTVTRRTPGYEELFMFNVAAGKVIGWGIDLWYPQPFFAGDHTRMHTTGGDISDPRGQFRIERDFTEYCAEDNGSICTQTGWIQSIDNPGVLRARRVPEPPTLVILLLAVVGLLASRRGSRLATVD